MTKFPWSDFAQDLSTEEGHWIESQWTWKDEKYPKGEEEQDEVDSSPKL